jgi:hypothetical protein
VWILRSKLVGSSPAQRQTRHDARPLCLPFVCVQPKAIDRSAQAAAAAAVASSTSATTGSSSSSAAPGHGAGGFRGGFRGGRGGSGGSGGFGGRGGFRGGRGGGHHDRGQGYRGSSAEGGAFSSSSADAAGQKASIFKPTKESFDAHKQDPSLVAGGELASGAAAAAAGVVPAQVVVDDNNEDGVEEFGANWDEAAGRAKAKGVGESSGEEEGDNKSDYDEEDSELASAAVWPPRFDGDENAPRTLPFSSAAPSQRFTASSELDSARAFSEAIDRGLNFFEHGDYGDHGADDDDDDAAMPVDGAAAKKGAGGRQGAVPSASAAASSSAAAAGATTRRRKGMMASKGIVAAAGYGAGSGGAGIDARAMQAAHLLTDSEALQHYYSTFGGAWNAHALLDAKSGYNPATGEAYETSHDRVSRLYYEEEMDGDGTYFYEPQDHPEDDHLADTEEGPIEAG